MTTFKEFWKGIGDNNWTPEKGEAKRILGLD